MRAGLVSGLLGRSPMSIIQHVEYVPGVWSAWQIALACAFNIMSTALVSGLLGRSPICIIQNAGYCLPGKVRGLLGRSPVGVWRLVCLADRPCVWCLVCLADRPCVWCLVCLADRPCVCGVWSVWQIALTYEFKLLRAGLVSGRLGRSPMRIIQHIEYLPGVWSAWQIALACAFSFLARAALWRQLPPHNQGFELLFCLGKLGIFCVF